MRPKWLVFLLAAAAAASSAQTLPVTSPYDQTETPSPAEHEYSQQLRKELVTLRDAALSDDYAYQQVAHLTDNIGPRPEGSKQAEGAVNYVAGELRKLGLDVRLEEVKVVSWIRGAETADLVEYPGQISGTTQKIVLTALGGNAPTPMEGITGEVVVVHSFDALNALGREKVAGKVVLFNVPFNTRMAEAGYSSDAYSDAVKYRARGAKAAASLGAVAALVRSVGGDADYRLPHTGGSTAAGIPAGAVTSEDADLMERLASQGKVRIHLTLTSHPGPEVTSHNVIADIKGSEHPEQVVIVSGHLDSWDLGTGAIDDAAGVGMAMEAAKLMQQFHLHPKRTLRVIAWMDEERTATGRAAYAAAHQAEFPNHAAAIESDFGATHPMGVRAKISDAAATMLGPMQEILASFGANLVQRSADSPEADIELMAKAGVPAFGIMQDGRIYFRYHHTAADTLDKIVPQELRENAAVMTVLSYTLASLPEPLPR